MKTIKNKKFLTIEIVAAFLGAVLFLCIYGFKVLNPFDVNFLLVGGDLSQHYLGWELFRQGSWRPMIGLTDAAAYPYSTSVIFTDSIPVFSVLFKLILSFCDKPFQFFGFWGILCFAMQGFFAARLVKRRISDETITDKITILALSLLFLLCPFFIRRMFWHSALAGQFVLLMAIDLFDNSVIYSRLKLTFCWIFLGILVASTHIYFIAMCGVILFGGILYRFLFDLKIKKIHATEIILDIFCPLFGFIFWAVFTIYFLGGFNSNMSGGAPGIGYYSFNLNGFFNADDGFSRFLNELPFYEDGQYEGDAYLGFGALLLVIATVIAGVVKLAFHWGQTPTKSAKPVGTDPVESSEPVGTDPGKNALFHWGQTPTLRLICAIVVCLILTLLAASNEVTFNDRLLFTIPLPDFIEKLYSPFRSSGRLIWPVGYFIILGAVSGLGKIYSPNSNNAKNFSNSVLLCLISVCFAVLQLIDISPKLNELNMKISNQAVYINPVSNYRTYTYEDNDGEEKITSYDILTQICAGEVTGTKPAHIVFLDKDNLTQEELYGFTLLAIENHMTVNDFYFARFFLNRAPQIAVEYALSGRDDCVFIYKEDKDNTFEVLPLKKYRTDNFVVCIPDTGVCPQ